LLFEQGCEGNGRFKDEPTAQIDSANLCRTPCKLDIALMKFPAKVKTLIEAGVEILAVLGRR
jgi:hypothetical protein